MLWAESRIVIAGKVSIGMSSANANLPLFSSGYSKSGCAGGGGHCIQRCRPITTRPLSGRNDGMAC